MIFSNEMLKEMAKDGVKVIPGNIFGNIMPDLEWLKWLSYEPKFEKERIAYLNSKKVTDLSYEELKEISTYKRNKIMAKLFKIYGTNKCKEEEYMLVYDYMVNESIEELMLSKLTKEELQYAKKEIIRLSKIPKEELNAKITKERTKENYPKLSMVDSYILHVISDINHNRNISNLSKLIGEQINHNNAMSAQNERSL